MKIKSAQIQNFRTLEDVKIDFDPITTLIGPNGAGKSTILRALDWFFNGRPGELSDEDCSYGSVGKEIVVSVTFDGLTGRDHEELGKYAPEGSTTFTAWKIHHPDGTEALSANAKSFPEFNPIKAAAKVSDKKALYTKLRDDHPELSLPAAATGQAIIDAMTTWETENPDQLSDTPNELQTNFFGFNSSGKMSGLFDFVLVTADLRASEESVDGKSSIIGRILERSVDRTAADEEISAIVEESSRKQQQVYNEKFKTQLADLESRINSTVASFSPGREVSVAPTEVELRAPRTTFNVSVIDGSTCTAVDRQGHGFQRTLLISALQVLAESGAAPEDGVICLAIEEPELYQHPIQAQAFAKILRALVQDTDQNIQVVYATHSPYFLEPRYFNQVRRLTREGSLNPSVTIHSATVEDVKEHLRGVVDTAKVERQLDSLTTGQLSAALFASRVLLVEGTTEAAVLYGIGDRQAIGSLEARGLVIVAVNGKNNLPLAHAILTKIGIPTFTLFDGDKGFEARSKRMGKKEKTIRDEKNNHSKTNRILLNYFGLQEEDFPDFQIAEAAAVFDDHLEGFLESRWPAWMDSCRRIEESAGIQLSKNQEAYRLATLEADGDPPDDLLEIISRASGLYSTAGSRGD